MKICYILGHVPEGNIGKDDIIKCKRCNEKFWRKYE